MTADHVLAPDEQQAPFPGGDSLSQCAIGATHVMRARCHGGSAEPPCYPDGVSRGCRFAREALVACWPAVAVPAQLARTRADRGGWATLTVAVEKLFDAGLFLDDLVRRPCTLYELFLGRDLVEHVLRRRAFDVR